jgi:hypothetical protein
MEHHDPGYEQEMPSQEGGARRFPLCHPDERRHEWCTCDPGMAEKTAPSISEAATQLGNALAARRDGIADLVKEHPLAAAGVALGIGYVLGGGLITRTTARLVALGTRLGGAALVRDLLAQIAR